MKFRLTMATVFVALAAMCAEGPYLGGGIKIGELTPNSVIIWTRLTKNPAANTQGHSFSPGGSRNARRPQLPTGVAVEDLKYACPGAVGEVRIVYATDAKTQQTDWLKVDPQADFTRQIEITDLTPATKYQLRIESRSTAGTPGASLETSVKTAPAPTTPASVTFTVVTGQSFHRRDDKANGHKIYPLMEAMKPNFFVHTGDIVYYDKAGPVANNVALARFKWQRVYGLPFQKSFHNKIPSYFIKDDHDTVKNDSWPRVSNGDLTWEQGLATFREQVPMSEKTYRTFRWGKDLQVWLVEGRDFRSVNRMPDGPDKTIWGAEQIAWFKRTVQESDATFRILISPTPLVGPDRGKKNDNHANKGFTHEGDMLRQFIASQKNMFVVCGDRHWQYVSEDPKTGLREYSCGPTSDKHAGGFSKKHESDMHKYLNIKGGFLSVTVTREGGRPLAIMRHHSVSGDVYNEDRLTSK